MVHHNITRISTYFDSSTTATKTEECIGECFTLLWITLGWPSFSSWDPSHCAPKCNQLPSAQSKLHEKSAPLYPFVWWVEGGSPIFHSQGAGQPLGQQNPRWFLRHWTIGILKHNQFLGRNCLFCSSRKCRKEWRDGLATAYFVHGLFEYKLDEQIFLMTRPPTSCECLIEVGLFFSLWKDHFELIYILREWERQTRDDLIHVEPALRILRVQQVRSAA